MELIKDTRSKQPGSDFRGEVQLESSVCYDFVASLRALFNPRTFTRSRRWASEQLPRLGGDVLPKGKFLFQGFDTALGYGAARVIRQLPTGAAPADLIGAVARMAPVELAMCMLDTGWQGRERLEVFERVLSGERSRIGEAVDGLPSGWGARCRQVLRNPEAVQADLVTVLEVHLSEIYAQHLEAATQLITQATSAAQSILDILPTTAAIEHLTGGWTLGADLGQSTVTLAPSVFIYPYMSARIDEDGGDSLIVYGIPSDIFNSYDPVPMRSELLTALKAMSDNSRLTMLRMLADRPMYASELASQLRLGQPTIHHHVHQLRTAGLVRQERDRAGMKYSIRTDSAVEILRSLEDWILGPTAREAVLASANHDGSVSRRHVTV